MSLNWRKLADPAAVRLAWSIETAAARLLLRRGAPDMILHFLGGLGDEVLLTCVAHEVKRRQPRARIWQIGAARDALLYNPDYDTVLGMEHWELRHSNLLERWRMRFAHTDRVYAGYAVPPRVNLLHNLCRTARLAGQAELRPRFFFTAEETRQAAPVEMQFCVQSVGVRTHETWAANKTWFHGRYEEVIARLHRRWPAAKFIQLGNGGDLPLRGADDRRSRTTIREAAVLLRQSVCFIGTVGFLMHLARAVDCRSVILFGGREHAWQSGYPCNENLETRLDCAPCWLDQECDRSRACMAAIGVADVENAVLRVREKRGRPLETVIADLDAPPPAPLSYPIAPGWSGIAHLPPFGRGGSPAQRL